MSWQISLVKNTVKVSEECAQEVLKKVFSDGELQDIYEQGLLVFPQDWMEHQDYVPQVLDILAKYKVSGDIAFCTIEGGPNIRNTLWVYRFDNGKVEQFSKKLIDII